MILQLSHRRMSTPPALIQETTFYGILEKDNLLAA